MIFDLLTFGYLWLILFWGFSRCVEQALLAADSYYEYLYPDAHNAKEKTFKRT